MPHDFQSDIDAIARIDAIPTILDVVCRTTGMGFAAVARVTPERWVVCEVLDNIDFGLRPGGELKVETTICHELEQRGELVVIDNVAESERYRTHHTPLMYGFQSYISVPIVLRDGSFFGTLCAIDPRPARLQNPETIGMFKLFAELIASHLDADSQLLSAREELKDERRMSELREQFVAVLGHDLRNPVAAIDAGTKLLLRSGLDINNQKIVALIQTSALRMRGLIDNVLDLARARLGDGLGLNIDADQPLRPALDQVVDELRAIHQDRTIDTDFELREIVQCDHARIAQLFSNLLANALTHGHEHQPITARAVADNGSFMLSVSNSGPPIPSGAMDSLFEPFFRGDARASQQGLGLGLYIASEIARLHDGRLDASSTAEQTCFTLTMPSRR